MSRMELRDLRERERRKRPTDTWRVAVTVWCAHSCAGSLVRSTSKHRGQGELEGDDGMNMLRGGGDEAEAASSPRSLGVGLEAGDTAGGDEESEDWTAEEPTDSIT